MLLAKHDSRSPITAQSYCQWYYLRLYQAARGRSTTHRGIVCSIGYNRLSAGMCNKWRTIVHSCACAISSARVKNKIGWHDDSRTHQPINQFSAPIVERRQPLPLQDTHVENKLLESVMKRCPTFPSMSFKLARSRSFVSRLLAVIMYLNRYYLDILWSTSYWFMRILISQDRIFI